ncbi:MAG: serine hydrolase domain-containing protein [Bacteroidota bacterium]
MPRLHLLALTFLVAAGCTAPAATPPAATPPEAPAPSWLSDLESDIDAIVADEMATNYVPGAAVVLVHNGRTLFSRGYGVADIESGRPVDPDRTLFRIGSVSKALTAMAVSRLVDDGRLRWDDDVAPYARGMTNPGGFSDPVRLEHLVTHTGGFDQVGYGRHVRRTELPLAERKALRPNLGDYLNDGMLRRVRPAGEHFVYDTYGISLAGHVLGEATGLSYREAMRRELFEPLGMTRSAVEAEGDLLADLAVGYGWNGSAYVAQPYEVYMTTPASSIDATPADMARLMEALTGGGTNAHGRLYSEAMAAEVLAPQYRPHPAFSGMSHGFWESRPAVGLPDGYGTRVLGHGGTMLGYATSLTLFVDANVAVFTIANRHAEAGGPWVQVASRVNEAVAMALNGSVDARPLALEPSQNHAADLDAYEGEYVRGLYCETCTEAEFAQGGWRRQGGTPITRDGDRLRFRDALYAPSEAPDVFVLVDGEGEQGLVFKRDASGDVVSVTTSGGPVERYRVRD